MKISSPTTTTIKQVEQIDRLYDKLFRVGRIKIELTKTNKELTKIEEDYVPKIHRIFKKIVSEYGSSMEKSYMLHDAEKKYGNEIRAIIKSMTTKTYLLGMEYVSRAMNKPELIYLTSTDLLNINLKADDGYRMFWRLINKYLQVIRNKTMMNVKTTRVAAAGGASLDYLDTSDVTLMDEVLTSSDEEDMRLLDTRTNAALITNAILTPVLAYSTIENYKQAKQQEQLIDKEVEAERQLFEGDYLSTTDLDQVEDEDATVVFATENDARVCNTCSNFEGMEWSINDPEIITPVVDTHPNCRCRLLLRINGEIMAK